MIPGGLRIGPGAHRWLAVLLTAVTLAVPAMAQEDGGADADQALERLEQIEEKIEQRREKLEDVRERGREISELIERIERRRAELAKELRGIRDRLTKLRRETRRLTHEIAELEKRAEQRRRDGGRAAAWALSLGHGGTLELLLRGERPSERIRNQGALRVTVDRLRTRLRTLSAELKRLQTARAELEANEAREKELLVERRDSRAEVRRREEQLRRSLDLLRRDERLTAGMLEDLEGARRELTQLIARTRSGEENLLPFDPYKGHLEPPVVGELLLDYGNQLDPVFDVRVEHPGWTIRVDKGTRVVAVAPGRVAYTGWLKGYGNLVVLQHGGEYFTLYGYLGEIFVEQGQSVGDGTPVGLSGDTGSLYGPALHFEIRHRREPLDPADWIDRRG